MKFFDRITGKDTAVAANFGLMTVDPKIEELRELYNNIKSILAWTWFQLNIDKPGYDRVEEKDIDEYFGKMISLATQALETAKKQSVRNSLKDLKLLLNEQCENIKLILASPREDIARMIVELGNQITDEINEARGIWTPGGPIDPDTFS